MVVNTEAAQMVTKSRIDCSWDMSDHWPLIAHLKEAPVEKIGTEHLPRWDRAQIKENWERS